MPTIWKSSSNNRQICNPGNVEFEHHGNISCIVNHDTIGNLQYSIVNILNKRSERSILTLEPSFGWTTCHIVCIDFSVSSASFPPTKVIIAKHSSNYNDNQKLSFTKTRDFKITGIATQSPSAIKVSISTIQAYRRDLRCFRPRFESLQNGRHWFFQYFLCFAPRTRGESQQSYKWKHIQNFWNSNKLSKIKGWGFEIQTHIFRTEIQTNIFSLPIAWDAKDISLADPRLMEFKHWCSNVTNLQEKYQVTT